ncbi:MAG TPA: hypothetical protein VGT02_13070 [Methylomirabilota bacterium]|jgi:hypothetical protein|nr:hypothetical protein [Methylomirabilota bacterium]
MKPWILTAAPTVQRLAGTAAMDGIRGDRADGLMDVLTVSGGCDAGAAAASQLRQLHAGVATAT